jgi:hypothetical protein
MGEEACAVNPGVGGGPCWIPLGASRCVYCDKPGALRGPMPGERVSALDIQHGGDHYKKMPIQPWEFIAANNIGHFEAAAIEYLARWKVKGGIDDLRKAVHHIEYLIEFQEKRPKEKVWPSMGTSK